MLLDHNYWYFKSVLTPRFCDDVIHYALNKKEHIARAGEFADIKHITDEEVKKFPIYASKSVKKCAQFIKPSYSFG